MRRFLFFRRSQEPDEAAAWYLVASNSNFYFQFRLILSGSREWVHMHWPLVLNWVNITRANWIALHLKCTRRRTIFPAFLWKYVLRRTALFLSKALSFDFRPLSVALNEWVPLTQLPLHLPLRQWAQSLQHWVTEVSSAGLQSVWHLSCITARLAVLVVGPHFDFVLVFCF